MEIKLNLRSLFTEFKMNLEDIIGTWNNVGLKTYYLIFGDRNFRCPNNHADEKCKELHQERINSDVNRVEGYWGATSWIYEQLINAGIKRSQIVQELNDRWMFHEKFSDKIRIVTKTGKIRKPPIYKEGIP
jgi:hypothetical protein